MKAIVLGSTGLVGSQVLKLLLQNTTYSEVVTIGRSSPNIDHPKLRKIVTEFIHWKEEDFLGDVLFCCLGTTIKKARTQSAFRVVDYDMPLAAGKLFNGHFILVSALGADPHSKIFYSKVKGELERDLQSLGNKLTVVRPSLLLGERAESRPLETFSQKITPALGWLLPGKLKKYAPIEASHLAKIMIEIANGEKVIAPELEIIN
jgi:uncharacterized protein YbjT (DUF2867 family)